MSKAVRKKNVAKIKVLNAIEDSSVEVGWHEDADPYDNGKAVAEVAYDNEFGNSQRGVPQRSFFRTTIHEKESEWVRKTAALVKKGRAARVVMDLVGNEIQGNVQEKIQSIAAAGGNSEATIARKGFDSPLIDSSHMLKTISKKVTVKK